MPGSENLICPALAGQKEFSYWQKIIKKTMFIKRSKYYHK